MLEKSGKGRILFFGRILFSVGAIAPTAPTLGTALVWNASFHLCVYGFSYSGDEILLRLQLEPITYVRIIKTVSQFQSFGRFKLRIECFNLHLLNHFVDIKKRFWQKISNIVGDRVVSEHRCLDEDSRKRRIFSKKKYTAY